MTKIRLSQAGSFETNSTYMYVLKKKPLLFWFLIKLKENIKIHHFKDKIVNRHKIKNEKKIGLLGLIPGRMGTSPPLYRMSYADSCFWTFEPNVSRMHESILKHHILNFQKTSLSNNDRKKIKSRSWKITVFVSFRRRPEVTADFWAMRLDTHYHPWKFERYLILLKKKLWTSKNVKS